MTSTTRAYFDSMYQGTKDPWHLETSDYERRKYELTLLSLPKSRYLRAFEPGCSIGVLSELLAKRCHHLTTMDFMDAPLEEAAKRLNAYQNVQIERGAIPHDWPIGPFDLIVLSEVAYYFDEDDLRSLMAQALASCVRGAHIAAVHWLGETDYPLTGERTHEIIAATPHLRRRVHHREDLFVIDVWEYDV